MRRIISSILVVFIMITFLSALSYAESNDLTSTSEQLIEQGYYPIEQKQTIMVDNVCEFSVDHINIAHRVDPISPSRNYTYYEADFGKQYVDICIAYKNLATTNVQASSIGSCVIMFAGQYYYNGFSMIETENRGNFASSDITYISPLSTEYYHFMSNIPDEVANSSGEIIAALTIGNQKFCVIVREGETGKIISPNAQASSKQEGDIALNEDIFIDDSCEFSLIAYQITKDVIPPQPVNFYTHYEAFSGKQFVDFCFKYRNMASRAVRADSLITGLLLYDNKYEYSGFSMIESNNRGDFAFANTSFVEPLTYEYIHYMFEVPDEVVTSGLPINVSFIIDNNSYSFNVA